MLKRKVYSELLQWKDQRRTGKLKKCLLVKGARQVGKSYIIREFGEREYKSFLNIDFFRGFIYNTSTLKSVTAKGGKTSGR